MLHRKISAPTWVFAKLHPIGKRRFNWLLLANLLLSQAHSVLFSQHRTETALCMALQHVSCIVSGESIGNCPKDDRGGNPESLRSVFRLKVARAVRGGHEA